MREILAVVTMLSVSTAAWAVRRAEAGCGGPSVTHVKTVKVFSKDEVALRAIATAFVDAWNKHDAKAIAAAYTDDGEVVDPFGMGKGRDGIEKQFATIVTGPGKNSTTTLAIHEWEPLKGGYALVNLDQEVTGMLGPDGKAMPVTKFSIGCLAVKTGAKWQLRYCHAGMVPQTPAK